MDWLEKVVNHDTTSTSNGIAQFVKYLNDNSSLTNVLVELNFDDTEKVYYTIGADLISQKTDGEISYYLYDGHGTVRALADIDGAVTDTYSYDAFGNLLKSTGKTANNYRYCGEQFDSTTGLYYLRARYMDTSTGRFISQDSYAGSTADPVSLHKYLYANSNPVMYCDPSGYSVEGTAALALSGDEYAVNRMAIRMTTSEMGWYNQDAYQKGQHIADVIVVGLMIIAALTNVLAFVSTVYDFTLLMEQILTEGTVASPSTEYRDDVIASSCPDPKEESEEKKVTYTVYKLVVKGSEKVEYVGRTKDFEATKIRHANNPFRSHLKPDIIQDNLTYEQARGLEQYFIEYYSTLNRNKNNPMNNQINGVNQKNINKYNYFMQIASDYLENITYVG